jgi:hypothetical protein
MENSMGENKLNLKFSNVRQHVLKILLRKEQDQPFRELKIAVIQRRSPIKSGFLRTKK